MVSGMTTARECNLWGMTAGSSEPQLYQFARRRAVESWEYSYGHRDFVAGVANRRHTVMPQQLVFNVCRLALQAQARATRYASRPA